MNPAKKRQFLILALFVLIIVGLLFGRIFFKKNPDVSVIEEKTTSTPNLVATTTISFLDGTTIPLDQVTSTLVAAMIDNYTLPQMQFGLAQASVVFEAPVEGGITRMLAIFPLSADITKIGPIRSARPYYLDWVKEFNALYLHVGGSPEALEQIKNKEILDLNEYYNGNYYQRDSARIAPHNVFTSTDLLKKAWEDKFKNTNSNFVLSPWLFKTKEDKNLGSTTSTAVVLGSTVIEWRYNKLNNSYERYLNGEKQKDANGQVITAKNVAIIFTDIKSIDEIDRKEIRTIGTGRALVLRDGREIASSWEKKSLISRTKFFGPDTKEIQFNPGVTWIEVTIK